MSLLNVVKHLPGRHTQQTHAGGRGSSTAVNEALGVVRELTLSGGDIGKLSLSSEARNFLKKTVTQSEYKLYRGMRLMRFRVDDAVKDELNNLQVGDKVPDYLTKSGNDFTSFTAKDKVANRYAKEADMSLVMETQVPGSRVLADLRNLKKVLKKEGIEQDLFDEEDFKYFNSEAEIIVEGLPASTVHSVSGRLRK